MLILSQRECVAVQKYKYTETGHHTVSGWDVRMSQESIDFRPTSDISSDQGSLVLTVLMSSRGLQATPHIVGLKPSVLGDRHLLVITRFTWEPCRPFS